jgi:uncharacterized damage-inducible protein DinB
VDSDVSRLVADIEAQRSAIIASLRRLSAPQAEFRASADAWSVTDIVEHLYLAEVSGVTKIWAAAEKYRAGERWTEAVPNAGLDIESIVQATWKPREVAPPIATPHIGGPLAVWLSAFASLQHVLADAARVLDELPLDAVIFPHFLSGPMDARQRLQFLRFHMQRHASQIAAIRGQSEFPTT